MVILGMVRQVRQALLYWDGALNVAGVRGRLALRVRD